MRDSGPCSSSVWITGMPARCRASTSSIGKKGLVTNHVWRRGDDHLGVARNLRLLLHQCGHVRVRLVLRGAPDGHEALVWHDRERHLVVAYRGRDDAQRLGRDTDDPVQPLDFPGPTGVRRIDDPGHALKRASRWRRLRGGGGRWGCRRRCRGRLSGGLGRGLRGGSRCRSCGRGRGRNRRLVRRARRKRQPHHQQDQRRHEGTDSKRGHAVSFRQMAAHRAYT